MSYETERLRVERSQGVSMLNFTVGPVMSDDVVLAIGGEQVPYFRTPEFSRLMLENERCVLDYIGAPSESRAVFLTNSSTGAMEAAVMNCLGRSDRALVVDGGTFGHRFVELCKIHDIAHDVIELEYGQGLSASRLYEYDGRKYTALLVNIGETSTGVLYDANMIGEFCRRNDLFYICDCVSSFLADPFDMRSCGADIVITGSQKALACPPGVSIVVMSPRMVSRIATRKVESLYFDLHLALKNMERGQTPFTPAVGILRQIHARFREIDGAGGVDAEIKRVAALAGDFREKAKHLPLTMFTDSPSNAVTSLHPSNGINAYEIFEGLKNNCGIWVCPNGGTLRSSVLRVGHIGKLSPADNTRLVDALTQVIDVLS